MDIHNSIMDIHNSIMDIHNSIMDIHNSIMDIHNLSQLWISIIQLHQSGTEPNLVAKIWPPDLVTICAWLPKLVANVSFNFHHLVNTGLAVGSSFKWLPITVAHTCKLDTIWVVYIRVTQ